MAGIAAGSPRQNHGWQAFLAISICGNYRHFSQNHGFSGYYYYYVVHFLSVIVVVKIHPDMDNSPSLAARRVLFNGIAQCLAALQGHITAEYLFARDAACSHTGRTAHTLRYLRLQCRAPGERDGRVQNFNETEVSHVVSPRQYWLNWIALFF
jgi:hypothetical protein